MTTGEYARYLAEHGGMATCGGHLGVMVAPRDVITGKQPGCPRGWIFIALEEATPERVQEALDSARHGRTTWPPKASWDKQAAETLRT